MNGEILKISAAAIAGALFASSLFSHDLPRKRRPNLLFIMTDQQRFDALAAAGRHGFLRTPNLDRLAGSGAFFTNAYTPCAVSGPARACILTGQLVEHTNVRSNALTEDDPVKNNFTTKKTFDQILADEGYYSEYHGKWHAPIGWTDCYKGFAYKTPDKGRPFSYRTEHMAKYRDLLRRHGSGREKEEGDLLDRTMFGAYYKPDPIDRRAVYGCGENGELAAHELKRRAHTQPDNHGLLRLPADLSLTAFQARETIAALDRAGKSGRPFNITCSFFFPHSPMLPTKPFHGMYDAGKMPVPPSISDEMADSPYRAANARLQLREYADPELVKYMAANYFALVSEVDMWVGKILEKLDEMGERDNTLVVFTSDHGEMLGAHGMREKNVFLEESARVPLILNFPGRIRPTIIRENTTLLDLFPTILDYMGVEYDARDGKSLAGAIAGSEKKDDLVVTEWLYRNPKKEASHMIVDGRWKLILSCDPESKVPSALYNLESDPYEMENLVGKSNPKRGKFLEKAAELRDKMAAYLASRNSSYANSVSQKAF